jgi:hypothetical protein
MSAQAKPEQPEAAKKTKTRRFRGQDCPITRTTKDPRTGAIYDLVQVKRSVTNRRDASVSQEFVGHKLRRPGTGVADVTEEIVIEDEEV